MPALSALQDIFVWSGFCPSGSGFVSGVWVLDSRFWNVSRALQTSSDISHEDTLLLSGRMLLSLC